MRQLLIFLFAISFSLTASAGVYVFTGVYQGKDLYVKNPFSEDGVGFCVFEVTVNGEVTTDEINSSAFAIDLALFELEVGDPVEVVIRTKDNCEPRVINPEDISPRSEFEVEFMTRTKDRTIVFRTTREAGALPFVVEQFKWNKWVQVGVVDGEGLSETPNEYTMEVPLHSGENTLRVRQDDARGSHHSDKFTLESDVEPVKLVSDKFFEELRFSARTAYEVFDAYGVLYAKGVSDKVDTQDWPKGDYYVNFDNRFGVAVRKR
jgi:hypothetical protein